MGSSGTGAGGSFDFSSRLVIIVGIFSGLGPSIPGGDCGSSDMVNDVSGVVVACVIRSGCKIVGVRLSLVSGF